MSGSNSVQTITFNEIPYAFLVPGTYVEMRPNYTNAGVFDWPARVLIVAQMLSSGTATPGIPYQLLSEGQAIALFGAGSQAQEMAWAFLEANPYTRVDIIGVADAAAGGAATGTITLGGAVTAAGTLNLYLAGRYVPVAVGATDTLATIQTNTIAAINAVVKLPLVASAGAGTSITLTAKHKGTIGNGLNLRTNYRRGDALPPGLTVAIIAMSGGLTDPSLSGVISAISSTWYTDIALPFDDTLMAAELDRRYGAMVGLDAHAYVGVSGTYAALVTAATGFNSRFRTRIPVTNAPNSPWVWAASLCGVQAFQSSNDPARQTRGLVLPGLLAPADIDAFYAVEREILLTLGYSTWNSMADGTVVIERVVTENKTDTLGVATTAWQDIMAPKVYSRIRYDWRVFVTLQYPNNKLADDGSLAAEADDTVVTPSRMKGSWAGRSRLYEQKGWIEESAATAQASIFVRDGTDRNRLNARQEVRRIGNLMVLAGALEFQV